MGYKIKAQFFGYVSEIDENNIEFRLKDAVTQDEYYWGVELEKIQPQSEQKRVQRGAFVRVNIRQKITFKFYKKQYSWRSINRVHRKVRRKYGGLLDRWKENDDRANKTVEL